MPMHFYPVMQLNHIRLKRIVFVLVVVKNYAVSCFHVGLKVDKPTPFKSKAIFRNC